MSETEGELFAEHFESLEGQAHAARFGMWIFLASEVLLFAGFFALFVTHQTVYPEAFRESVHHNTKLFGTINTGVLLVSSWAIASSVHALRAGLRGRAVLLITITMLLGGVFLGIKGNEYADHFHDGIYPGGHGAFFAAHAGDHGIAAFWTLYFAMTGLHAVHVTVGMIILGFLAYGIARGRIRPPFVHRLEIGAIYWHLIDVIWIFLWPLFYLA